MASKILFVKLSVTTDLMILGGLDKILIVFLSLLDYF